MMKICKLIGKHENFAQETIPKTLPTSGFFLVGLENSGKILFFAKTLITFERNINISFCFQQMKVESSNLLLCSAFLVILSKNDFFDITNLQEL